MQKSKKIKLITAILIIGVAVFLISTKFFSSKSIEETYKLMPVKLTKDGKISLMDVDGKIVLEDEFSKESTVFYSEGIILERTNDGSVKYYTLDGKKTKQIGANKYSAGNIFVNDFAVVRKDNGMLALIDKTGIEKIGNLSFIDKYNIILAGVNSEGLIRIKTDEGKWGYVTTSGEMKIKPEFKSCENFNNGKARVIKDDGSFAIIDKSGEVIFKGKEDYYYYPISEDLIGFKEQTGSSEKEYYGFLDLKGEKVIKDNKYMRFDGSFKSGKAVVRGEESDSWGVIDKTGEVVGDLKLKFEDEPIISNDGMVFVNNSKDAKCKIFNNKGVMVKEIEDFKMIIPIAPKRYLALQKGDKERWVILNDEGKEITKDAFYFTNFISYYNAINQNTDFLNNQTLASTYFDFEPLFANIFKKVSNNGIFGVNENSNIGEVLSIWPYESPSNVGGTKTYVSRSDNYSKEMYSASAKKDKISIDSKTEEALPVDSTDVTAAPDFTTAPAQQIQDNYSFLSMYSYSYSPQRRYSDGISYSLSFYFDSNLKEAITAQDPIYGNQITTGYSVNNNARLTSINCYFDLAGIDNDQFTKQLENKLTAAGWKKDSDVFTNTSNSITIRFSGSAITMNFQVPTAPAMGY